MMREYDLDGVILSSGELEHDVCVCVCVCVGPHCVLIPLWELPLCSLLLYRSAIDLSVGYARALSL